MVYTQQPRVTPLKKKWSRPKERIAGHTYMKVRDYELMRELREEQGLTQTQLAVLSKCSQATISAIENENLTTISVDLGTHLAYWLGRRPRELFDEFDDREVAAVKVKIDTRRTRHRKAEPAA
ncbi:helix-turn-helix transcriptional regulator [Auritidibacter ignavus]|uniref:helix-turn-helix transcriptional regulator n=1 Tax=Auritidibacter ignavus TaxID=678932 RepID=UPI00141BEF2A|nr:helix-turn-helix transcriptional regulator [Auritidibacter ignavus]NIH72252.1 transcriptional regulator with XRE-family HTH domain [Auritidibacter ignavus]WGH82498.1 helix-turn-helix transcriptional regulator [Auritidibacter ignavus]WGH87063.1 helix-turn-helix transcriptional regulator [Auritidibacter ignavus]WGH89347.1 helix-turn-helix transcriptional regulator [Auritidibacter ignavus]WGH91690.1 helix-turn-helix transcriptional regulator [Auritidibacter ignavus]